jgi:negative regulator of flagellin synthesis FlgM
MTDAISNYGRRAQSDASLRSSLDKTDRKSATSTASLAAPIATGDAKPTVSPGPDQLHMTNVAQKAMAEPDFDKAKVDSIKQALQDGQYPLNPRRIAESFFAIEQMIRE